jgi:cell division protease FtsH
MVGTIAILLALGWIVWFNLTHVPSPDENDPDIAYSYFLALVDKGDVRSVNIRESKITLLQSNGRHYITYMPNDPSLVRHLVDAGVQVWARPDEQVPPLLHILLNWFPFLVYCVILWFGSARPLLRMSRDLRELNGMLLARLPPAGGDGPAQ